MFGFVSQCLSVPPVCANRMRRQADNINDNDAKHRTQRKAHITFRPTLALPSQPATPQPANVKDRMCAQDDGPCVPYGDGKDIVARLLDVCSPTFVCTIWSPVALRVMHNPT